MIYGSAKSVLEHDPYSLRDLQSTRSSIEQGCFIVHIVHQFSLILRSWKKPTTARGSQGRHYFGASYGRNLSGTLSLLILRAQGGYSH
jgi:hypothetical protein